MKNPIKIKTEEDYWFGLVEQKHKKTFAILVYGRDKQGVKKQMEEFVGKTNLKWVILDTSNVQLANILFILDNPLEREVDSNGK